MDITNSTGLTPDDIHPVLTRFEDGTRAMYEATAHSAGMIAGMALFFPGEIYSWYKILRAPPGPLTLYPIAAAAIVPMSIALGVGVGLPRACQGEAALQPIKRLRQEINDWEKGDNGTIAPQHINQLIAVLPGWSIRSLLPKMNEAQLYEAAHSMHTRLFGRGENRGDYR